MHRLTPTPLYLPTFAARYFFSSFRSFCLACCVELNKKRRKSTPSTCNSQLQQLLPDAVRPLPKLLLQSMGKDIPAQRFRSVMRQDLCPKFFLHTCLITTRNLDTSRDIYTVVKDCRAKEKKGQNQKNGAHFSFHLLPFLALR